MSNSDNKLYFYENYVDVVFTTDQFYVDNRPMDTRHLKVHKGVTNEIIFTVRNRDRKLQNVTSDTVRAYIIKPSTSARVITRIMENTLDVGKLKLPKKTSTQAMMRFSKFGKRSLLYVRNTQCNRDARSSTIY